MSTIDRVKTAFRKLKAHVYFDKTTLPLRDKVVEFESKENFLEKLTEIAMAYDNAILNNNSSIVSEILSSISTLPFPKSMTKTKQNENTVISVGIPKETPKVSDLQYFIDMDVRGHILGILWIMAFGKRLDDMCIENSRGNRLRQAHLYGMRMKVLK